MVRLGPAIFAGRARVMGGGLPGEQTSACNRLAAYEIRTGKLRWHIGGPAGPHRPAASRDVFPWPAAAAVGPALRAGRDQGRNPAAGPRWRHGQPPLVAAVGRGRTRRAAGSTRRWAGASPSYADGVLVCPTTTGAIVGVELATRSLLWGYRYGHSRAGNRMNMGMPMRSIRAGTAALDRRQRLDRRRPRAGHAGRIRIPLLPEPDRRRAAVEVPAQGRFVRGLRRPGQSRAGGAPRGAGPAPGRRQAGLGRPHHRAARNQHAQRPRIPAGDRYFLPLTSAEVVGIDLGKGKIVQVAKSRKGDVPGNLICHQGKVISQGPEGVDAYYQLDAVQAEARRRLAANPNDAEALSLRGEILLDAGKRAEAVASFRRAYELDADPRTRDLLRDSLLEGLRTDFAAYRGRGDEVERLVDDPSQHAVYLRLMADGLRQAGEWAPAFDYYQKLVDLEPEALPLDQVDPALDRAARPLVPGPTGPVAHSEAKDEAAAKIDAAVAARLQAAVAAGSIDAVAAVPRLLRQPAGRGGRAGASSSAGSTAPAGCWRRS